MNADHTIDTSGTFCPIPVIEAQKAIRPLAPGATLLVIATDPGVKTDFPDWCKAAGHELLALDEAGAKFHVYVRKKK